MATGTLFYLPWETVLDASGLPVVGAKAYFYVPGTTTLATTFSDYALTTPSTNPVETDAAGRLPPIYLSPGSSYKLALTTAAGATIHVPQDNIPAVPALSGNVDIPGTAGEALTAGKAVYLSDGSGGKVAGQWYLADSSLTYSSTLPQVGIATAAISSGTSGTIRQQGQVTGLTSLTVGAQYYIGTAGALTATAPTNARLMGVADSTSTLVLSGAVPLGIDLLQIEAFS